MELMWAIYFIDVLASEGGHAFFGSLMLIIGCGAYLVGKHDKYMPDFHLMIPIKSVVTLSVLLILYGALMPSKDTAYKMLAAYGVTEIAANEQVQQIGSKSLAVLEKAMDEYLEESKDK